MSHPMPYETRTVGSVSYDAYTLYDPSNCRWYRVTFVFERRGQSGDGDCYLTPTIRVETLQNYFDAMGHQNWEPASALSPEQRMSLISSVLYFQESFRLDAARRVAAAAEAEASKLQASSSETVTLVKNFNGHPEA